MAEVQITVEATSLAPKSEEKLALEPGQIPEEKKEEVSPPTEETKKPQPEEKIPEKAPEKTPEEKKKEFLERQTAILVEAIKDFVGGKRLTSTEIVRVIAHAMSVAAKMKIDNTNKKIVVIAGIKAYINGTDWPEDDKIVLTEFVDLTISSTIDTFADVHKNKIDLTQPTEMSSKSVSSQKSCCTIL